MDHILIAIGTIVCAIQAVRAARLLVSAIWLAGTSALVALEMYILGAPEIAVIELSVGAGLVTILFVFAINLTGEENFDERRVIPRSLAGILLGVAGALLLYFILPEINITTAGPAVGSLQTVFWNDRKVDTLLQILMIFSGVLGVMGLLEEEKQGKTRSGKERRS